jgi:flagellar protein FlaI
MPENTKPCSYTIEMEGDQRNLLVNCIGCFLYPSLEDNKTCMERVVDYIVASGTPTNVILSSSRNVIYPAEQTKMIVEIANLYKRLVKEETVFDINLLSPNDRDSLPDRLAVMRDIVLGNLRGDPIGAYVQTLRELREQRAKLPSVAGKEKLSLNSFINVLAKILDGLEKTGLIRIAMPDIPGHTIGNRDVYRKIFKPLIKPNFMLTRLMSEPPIKAQEVDSYSIGGKNKSDVSIFKIPGKVQYLYHLSPPEFKLDEDEYVLLDEARNILAKHKPEEKEFVDPKRVREIFTNISRDLIEQLANSRGVKMKYEDIEKLSEILVRLTVGFGLTEVLLEDERIEDVYINAPVGSETIFIKHAEYGECFTNIIPSYTEADAWASRFRMISGRPLDEANPVLDAEIITPNVFSRATVIQNPISPKGLAFAFRRHRARPWTLPLFVKYNFLSPLSAGLISFLVDGARTILVAGTRGSGKTSFLTAIMVEIMRKFRMITVEDTMELPESSFREMGYNILPMKVRSAIVGSRSEMSAAEGIRTSLRLGDSSLIIGEVRSKEAVALYEAMRIGALANVVAGTIHGDSPYGVFDRVVNDLGVPRTSFKATDIIIIANKIRSPDLLTEMRRIMNITEVRKHWEEDPLREKGFVDLMEYNSKKDVIEPTQALLEGESEVLKSIGSRVREWIGNWDRIWENIQLRADIKGMLVQYSEKEPKVLEANFVVDSNDKFHMIFEDLSKETGYPDSERVKSEFEEWLKAKIKNKNEKGL